MPLFAISQRKEQLCSFDFQFHPMDGKSSILSSVVRITKIAAQVRIPFSASPLCKLCFKVQLLWDLLKIRETTGSLLLLKNYITQHLIYPTRKEACLIFQKYSYECLTDNRLSNFWQLNSMNISQAPIQCQPLQCYKPAMLRGRIRSPCPQGVSSQFWRSNTKL